MSIGGCGVRMFALISAWTFFVGLNPIVSRDEFKSMIFSILECFVFMQMSE